MYVNLSFSPFHARLTDITSKKLQQAALCFDCLIMASQRSPPARGTPSMFGDRFSDLIIVCEKYQLPGHCVIVCNASEYFANKVDVAHAVNIYHDFHVTDRSLSNTKYRSTTSPSSASTMALMQLLCSGSSTGSIRSLPITTTGDLNFALFINLVNIRTYFLSDLTVCQSHACPPRPMIDTKVLRRT